MESKTTQADERMMRKAIALATRSCRGGGGPFGAVIVKDGKVVAAKANSVTLSNDPTAHAEVNAIRSACRKMGTFDLSGCTLYTSCEPCPMCLGAIYWAGISRVFYGADRKDADGAGFSDDFIYREIGRTVGRRSIPTSQLLGDEAKEPFREWEAKDDKTPY